MYSRIKDPYTGKLISINKSLGKNIINKYIMTLRGGSPLINKELISGYIHNKESIEKLLLGKKIIHIKGFVSNFKYNININGEDVNNSEFTVEIFWNICLLFFFCFFSIKLLLILFD